MIIAGNWKMNLLRQEAVALARHLDRDLAHHPAEIIIFPATVLIPLRLRPLRGHISILARRIAMPRPLVRIQVIRRPGCWLMRDAPGCWQGIQNVGTMASRQVENMRAVLLAITAGICR